MELLDKKVFICDMDGVIYHGNNILPGVKEFVSWLKDEKKNFIFLTNSSERTPRELQQKMSRIGLDVDETHFYTSALATASFVSSQFPGCSAYVVGEGGGLVNALYDEGITMNDINPDYVIVGDSRSYSFEKIEKAIHLVMKGAKLVGTNPDVSGPSEMGLIPATGALISPIELVAQKRAYFVGKPNPLMMRKGLKKLGCRNEETVIIGDRMDTDIIAGIESEIDTVLVLSGVTSKADLKSFSYKPGYIFQGVGEIVGATM